MKRECKDILNDADSDQHLCVQDTMSYIKKEHVWLRSLTRASMTFNCGYNWYNSYTCLLEIRL